MKTYVFPVELEPDEDGWLVYCPALDEHAAETWGRTREEALANIKEVIAMILEGAVAEKSVLPAQPPEKNVAPGEALVAVTV